jgi:Phosphodiester glycosidase
MRLRRIALIAALVALVPVAFSYLQGMARPSNSSLGIRSVEWLRENGGAGIVSKIESIYYSLTAPSKGGPTLKALPSVGYATSRTAAGALGNGGVISTYRPPNIAPILQPALPGEGVWRSATPTTGAYPPILVTTLRNLHEYPRTLAGLAWIDTTRTRLTLNPGLSEPAVEMPRGSAEVPLVGRSRLLATFNSGFKLSDSGGGVVLNGRTYATMHDGQATLVGYRDGHVNVIAWNYGSRAPASVSFARQNLPLIVDHATPNPNLNDGPEWGATLGNAILVWRSAIGVDARGNLMFLAGDHQTVGSLAKTLVHAGAVRAMELDINSYWVSFITYGRPGAKGPLNLLPDMKRSPYRYLEPDDRDFFAVYAK